MAPILRKLLTEEMWEKKLESVQILREDMNKIVMNFLVIEGFVDAAEMFKFESGTEPDIDLARNTERMAVKKGVECGNYEGVVEKVHNLIPNIMDSNPELIFHLQQLRTVELIRSGMVNEALDFAMKELAPIGEAKPIFMKDIENTMTMLMFEDFSTCPFQEVINLQIQDISKQRLKIANEINAAILTTLGIDKDDPKLPRLLKMVFVAQELLEEKTAFPKISDLSTVKLIPFKPRK